MDTGDKIALFFISSLILMTGLSIKSCHEYTVNEARVHEVELTARTKACLASGQPASTCGFVKQVSCE